MTTGPLSGRHVVVTREERRASRLVEVLESLGAHVTAVPLVRTERLDPAELHLALHELRGFDWLLFTSRTGVEIAAETLATLGTTPASLAGLRVAAVGPATAAALQEAGFAVALVPERHTAEGLLEALVEHESLRGRRFLYVAAAGARDALPEGLNRRGAECVTVSAYRTLDDVEGQAALRDAVVRGAAEVVVVAAPSAVAALERACEGVSVRPPVATIGPVTTAAARAAGFLVVAEAEEATPGALARALGEWSDAQRHAGEGGRDARA